MLEPAAMIRTRWRAELSRTSGFLGLTGTITFEGDSRIPRKTVSLISITGAEFMK